MKLKKIMAIGLICTMTASAFAGCGGAKKEETAKTEDGIPEERLQLEFLEIWWKSLMLHRINMRSTA